MAPNLMPCAGNVDKANQKWATTAADTSRRGSLEKSESGEGSGTGKIDSNAFLKQIMSGSTTG